jgi:tetratricopeptide (TPR) repeat protein
MLTALDARAASLRSALQDASQLLADGDAPGAIASYREIQVEYPDSEEAKFGIGCSQYVQGAGQSATGALEEAATSFQAAEEVFRRLSTAQDSRIREGAVYNRANTVAQKAKMIPPQEQYKEAVAALGEAVSAYEEVLRDFPEHKGAGQNLDHVRYQLKQLQRKSRRMNHSNQ